MSIGLLFSGQGAQAVGMGKSLYENSDICRSIYDEADSILGWSLTKVSFDGPNEELTKTSVCQPALFVMGYAIAQELKQRLGAGEITAALGLSLGELTAMAYAGVFDFETGLKIVQERGRLMQQACEQTEGGMAAVIAMPEDKVAELCQEYDIDMANLNCPGQIIISGDKGRVEAAAGVAKERGAKMVSMLKVAGAYHSRLMEPARSEFEKYLADISFKVPQVKVFTNVTGEQVEEPEHIKRYLVDQVVSSVKWEQCVRNAAAAGITRFYECGPGAVLSGMARRTDKNWSVKSIADFSDLPQ